MLLLAALTAPWNNKHQQVEQFAERGLISAWDYRFNNQQA